MEAYLAAGTAVVGGEVNLEAPMEVEVEAVVQVVVAAAAELAEG